MVITQAAPETAFNALSLAFYSLEQGDEVRIFLSGKGVEIDQIEDPGFDVKGQAQAVLDAGGQFLACGACLKFRGSEGSEARPLSALKDHYEIVQDSDRLVTVWRARAADGEMRLTQAFDAIADSYDAWYDSLDGRTIFEAELACLRLLVGHCRGRWLEVGVGSGRFASMLGVAAGIDPSARMRETASELTAAVLCGRDRDGGDWG